MEKNNIDVKKNIENNDTANSSNLPIFVPTAESTSQALGTMVQFADAIVIENNGISTSPLSSSQRVLDNFESKYT